MVKVKELMSVHEYPEPLVLAVDLHLQGAWREERRNNETSESLAKSVQSAVTLVQTQAEQQGGVKQV